MTTPDLAQTYPQHVAELRRRTDVALERGGFDHLVVPSGSVRYQVFDDRDYPYAVNPQFKAWAPLTRSPGSWLVVTPGKTPKLIFLQPFDYWHVVPETPAGYWVDRFDIVIIRKPEEALQHLPANPARCAILGEASSTVGDYAPNNPAAVLNYLEYHRAFKTAYEMEMMRGASRVGVRGHLAAEAAFRAGASEFDIHMAYCIAARQDANELPYHNIVALNEHCAVLHYTDLATTPPAPIRSFLIDAGGSFGGYASDITRTYASDRGSEFQAFIDAIDAAQRAMCAEVRPGVDYRELHVGAHLKLAGVLQEFGLINLSPDAALAAGVSNAFFPHGIGHGIGLQVHDVAGFAESDAGGVIPRPAGQPFLRSTRTLEAGMVMTIEPGLYIIDMLLDEVRKGAHAGAVNWDRIEAFRPYGGVRIEDDVVCTDGDPINLTRDEFAAQT